jgi:hypothetical protein
MLETREITFEPVAHSYTDETKRQYISTTQLIGLVSEDYDDDYWATYRVLDMLGHRLRPVKGTDRIAIHDKTKREFVEYSYRQLAIMYNIKQHVSMIQQDWKDTTIDSCEWGSAKHSYLEECILRFTKTKGVTFNTLVTNNQDYRYKIVSMEELANSPLKFSYPGIYEMLERSIAAGWTIFVEKRVYHPDYLVAGTIDLLLIKDKDFVIIDWKTNKKPIYNKTGYYKKAWNANRTKKIETGEWVDTDDRFKHPINHLLYNKFNIYSLQLSIYSYILEAWGFNYAGNKLVHLPPLMKDGEFIRDQNGARLEAAPVYHTMSYLKTEVQTLFDWRLNSIRA